MPEAVIVKFHSPVSEASIGALMKVADRKLAAGVTQFTVLISTSGGSVFHGLTAYKYLKGIPADAPAGLPGEARALDAGPRRGPRAGLVHEIRQELFAEGAEVIPIQSGA